MKRRTFFQTAAAALTLGFLPKRTGPQFTHEDGWKVHRGDLHLDEVLTIRDGEKVRIEGILYSTALPYAVFAEGTCSLHVDEIVHQPPGRPGMQIVCQSGKKQVEVTGQPLSA